MKPKSGCKLEPAMESHPDHRPSVELLESTHLFPGVYQIKAIGRADDEFEQRVVSIVVSHLAAASDLASSLRTSLGGGTDGLATGNVGTWLPVVPASSPSRRRS